VIANIRKWIIWVFSIYLFKAPWEMKSQVSKVFLVDPFFNPIFIVFYLDKLIHLWSIIL